MKALLDSGAMGLLVDKKFMQEHGFKLEKLDRPIEVENVDSTSNSGGSIIHELECNIFYKGQSKRLRMHICNLGQTKMIVSNQPQAAAVPVRRDLRRDEGEGAPLIDWDD